MTVPSPLDAFLSTYSRPTLMFDVDGVLSFYMEAAIAILNARFNLSLVVADQTTYWLPSSLPLNQGNWLLDQTARGIFYQNLAPDLSGIAALHACDDAGWPIIVASDRPNTYTVDATIAWLDRWDIPHDNLILDGKGGKAAWIAKHASADFPILLFDDDPRKAVTVPSAYAQVWTPLRTWTPPEWSNYPGYHVFDSWDDVLTALGVGVGHPIPAFPDCDFAP